MCCKFEETVFTHNVSYNDQTHQHSALSSCSLGNSQDECFFRGEIPIVQAGFDSYMHLSWVFFLCVAGGCIVSHILLFMYKQFKYSHQPTFTDPQESAKTLEEENRYAQEVIGEDSVYQYLLDNSLWGWCICLTSIAVQLWMGYEFILGSEYDFERSSSDLTYTWTCPRDEVDCRNTDGMVEMFCLMCAQCLCEVFFI